MLLILRETEQFNNFFLLKIWGEAKPGNDDDALQNVGEYQQIFFLMQILTTQRVGSSVESVKKGKFMTKIFFQTMFS